MRKEDLRPCVAWNFDKAKYEEGYFHGWFQSLGGNLEDGVDGGACGIFEDKYGYVRSVRPNFIRFKDRDEKKKDDEGWQ